MRAARFHNKGDIRVEDIPAPQAKNGQVLVDVEWCGICGSDLHEYILGPNTFSMPDNPHILTGEHLPIAMGHEFCGRVRSPPAGSKLKDGQAVMVDPRILCGSCNPCKTGRDHSCRQLAYFGFAKSGGFAEQVSVEEHMLYPLPDNVPIECAAVIEPLAVVHHAIKVCGERDWAQEDILVIGGGPVGLALVIALKAHGAKRIIVSEPARIRREQVSEFVDTVLNPLNDKVADKCREMTDGLGVSVVFDCAGVPVGLETGFDALRVEGLYMNVAVWEKPMVLPMWEAMAKHITVKFSIIFNHEDFSEVMQMMAQGKFVGYEKLITSRIQLEDIDKKGFRELINNKDSHIKILVSPKT